MVLMMRVTGVMLAIFGVLGFAGSFDVNAQGKRQLELLPIFILMLAAAGFLWVRANRQSSCNRRVVLDHKLLSLTQLSRDGLAQFDIDADGAPIYRVSKLPPPRT